MYNICSHKIYILFLVTKSIGLIMYILGESGLVVNQQKNVNGQEYLNQNTVNFCHNSALANFMFYIMTAKFRHHTQKFHFKIFKWFNTALTNFEGRAAAKTAFFKVILFFYSLPTIFWYAYTSKCYGKLRLPIYADIYYGKKNCWPTPTVCCRSNLQEKCWVYVRLKWQLICQLNCKLVGWWRVLQMQHITIEKIEL